MRKVAACRIYISEKDFLTNRIVEIGCGGIVTKILPLSNEEAHTEWFTGTLLLSKISALSVHNITNIKEFYTTKPFIVTHSDKICCWYISNLNHMTGEITKPCIIECLK